MKKLLKAVKTFAVNLLENKSKKKPTEHIGVIQNKITSEENCKKVSISTFAKLVGEEGYTFKASYLEGGSKNENFISSYLVVLDFDENFTLDGLMAQLTEMNMQPTLVYYSFSHTSENPKVRVIWQLEDEITDKTFRDDLQKILMTIFPNADKACKDASRVYFGGKGIHTFNKDVYFNYDAILAYQDHNDLVLTKIDGEYKINNKIKVKTTKTRKISDGTVSGCQLYDDFLNGEVERYEEKHDALFHLACNLHQLEGFKEDYERIISEGNYSKKQNKLNIIKAVDSYTQKSSCVDRCPYQNECGRYSIKLIDNKITEEVNYSQYKADKTIKVDQFLSEAYEQIEELIQFGEALPKFNKKLLLAPTGSGKTFTMVRAISSLLNTFKRMGIKIVFVVPNKKHAIQMEAEYKVATAYHTIDADKVHEKNTFSVMTWNKAGAITNNLSKTVFIIDEIHQTLSEMYRKEAIDGLLSNLKKCMARIDITATPNKLDLNSYDEIVEFEVKNTTDYTLYHYNNINHDQILDIINGEGKKAVFMNDIAQLQSIINQSNKKGMLITKDTKGEVMDLINEGTMGDYELLCNTSAIIAGLNIKDNDMTDIILIGEKDPATIKQYVARYRGLEKVNVHVFNTYASNQTETQVIEDTVKEIEEFVKASVSLYNSKRDDSNFLRILGLESSERKRELNIVQKDNGEFHADTLGIRSRTFINYYNACGFKNFTVIMKEYFENIIEVETILVKDEIVKEIKKIEREEAKEAMKELAEVKDDLLNVYANMYKAQKEITEDTDDDEKEQIAQAMDLEYKLEEQDLLKHLNNRVVKKTLIEYTELVEEHSVTEGLAWELAQMGNVKKGQLEDCIKFYNYNKLVSAGEIFGWSIEKDVYDTVTQIVQVGDVVGKETAEVIKEVLESKQIHFSEKTISGYVNAIFNVKQARVNKKVVRVATALHTLETIAEKFELDHLDISEIKFYCNTEMSSVFFKDGLSNISKNVRDTFEEHKSDDNVINTFKKNGIETKITEDGSIAISGENSPI